MQFDLRRTFESLKIDFPDKFVGIPDFDTFLEDDLKQFLATHFTEAQLLTVNAEFLGLKYIDLSNYELDKSMFDILPISVMKRYTLIPFSQDENIISIAIADPNDYNAIQALKFIFQERSLKFELFVSKEDDINKLLSSVDINDLVQENVQEFTEKNEKSQELPDISDVNQENLGTAPIIKIVSVIIKTAVVGGASDIHIEGSDKSVRVRFRVDGVLHTSLMLPKELYSSIVARIKILSNLKIDEQRKPQDGRFSIIEQDKKIDFRVSTFPTQYGEKIVLRILDTSGGVRSLEALGFIGPKAADIQEAIQKPFGMILLTGPTGSGKSTTVYTLLSQINTEDINIVTLEDPIEYNLFGINQSQVRPDIDYTFATGLRSILRQDPDVIMVGEIRDGETAGLAVQSALTGHIVFSTLHTNDAPGAIPRLIYMGVESFLVSASVQAVIAQRLVKKLCEYCKEEVVISEQEKKYIQDSINKLDPIYVKQIYTGNFDKMYKPVGCLKCTNGFKGRIAIFEVVIMTEDLRFIVEQNEGEEAIMKYLYDNNYITLKQDGIFKVLLGYISLPELLTTVEI
ncbi:MAG: GspE/PulE family protein [Minisyncoccia bacterium]